MSNGACGENENCTSNSSGVTSCQCINGFNRTSEWLPCESLIGKNFREIHVDYKCS